MVALWAVLRRVPKPRSGTKQPCVVANGCALVPYAGLRFVSAGRRFEELEVEKMKRCFLLVAMFVLLSGMTVLAQAAGEDKSKEWPYGPYDKLHGAGRVGTGETLHFIFPAEANQNQIVGKWAADNRTKGGLGAMLIFGDDGVVTAIFGALVDCKYVVEGQTIKMTFPDTAEQTAEPYSIVGDKLIAYPADPDKREERTRVGTDRKSTRL